MSEFRDNPQVIQELEAIDTEGFPVHPMEAVAQGAVLGAVGKIAPHGYGLLMFQDYHELLPRRQRYPSGGSCGFVYWGEERTIDFGLVRQAINPENQREEFVLLGMFEFDCVPHQGTLRLGVQWEYTENGLLHLEVSQQGTGVSLPLYDISRLEGHKIARPTRSAPREASKEAVPRTAAKREAWTSAELDNAVRFGKQVLACAQERLEQASGEQQERILDLSGRLERWLQDETLDSDYRTPQIRDFGRALLNLLYVSRLIEANEVGTMRQGI